MYWVDQKAVNLVEWRAEQSVEQLVVNSVALWAAQRADSKANSSVVRTAEQTAVH